MKQIAAFTQGKLVPSTRFRISQYLNEFSQNEFNVTQFDALNSAYPPAAKWLRPLWLVRELFHRFTQLRQLKAFDVVILQREMISTLATAERFINKPIILDVDDAIFLRRNGHAAKKLAQIATHIVCGNEFLAAYFRQFNPSVSVIPTAVDTHRFVPGKSQQNLIGWSGSSSGFHYLYKIESALKTVLDANPDWKLHIVADKAPVFTQLTSDQVLFQAWSPDIEVQAIQKMAIGIMPLEDSEWTRGKCSYKMLLYMACGLPVMVSDVGMNSQLLNEALIGFGAVSEEQWIQGLQVLINDTKLRQQYGSNGRQLVEQRYSLTYCSKQWLKILQSEKCV